MNYQSIQKVADLIVEHFRPRRVILFGSYATGTATDQSDIDLLVVSDGVQDAREEALAIRRSLADFPIGFDIIVTPTTDYNRHRNVVNHIAYFADRQGKVLYER